MVNNFKLEKSFILETQLEFNTIYSILQTGIAKKDERFSEKILKGYLKNGIIKAVICPSNVIIIDIFKSVVNGRIWQDKTSTFIEISVKPNLAIIILALIWYFITLLMIVTYEYTDLENLLYFILINFIYILAPYLLIKFKISRDSKRLKKWIYKKIGIHVKT